MLTRRPGAGRGPALASGLCLAALVALPAAARADSGLAFLELGLLQLCVVGIVVVGIEAWVLRGLLALRVGQACGLSVLVNLASYLTGLPVLYLVSNQGPLYGHVNQYRNPWLSVALLLLTFALSLAVEAPLLRAWLKAAWRPLLRACLGANLASYLLVALLMGPWAYFPDFGIRPLFQAAGPQLAGTEEPP